VLIPDTLDKIGDLPPEVQIFALHMNQTGVMGREVVRLRDSSNIHTLLIFISNILMPSNNTDNCTDNLTR
jgi:hypothetical protein